MLESYFFVPGDKRKFLDKIPSITSDFIVVDLEDAVATSNKSLGLNEVKKLHVTSNMFIRAPFLDQDYSKDELKFLIDHFGGRIAIPKVTSKSDMEYILSITDFPEDGKIFLLVENPKCFMNLKEILHTFDSYITGIGFGTHDFCSLMGIQHVSENLKHYKRELILIAKAFEKKFLDTVDMNLEDLSNFEEDCLWAFNNGADGKFVIHPKQLEAMNSISYLSDDEIKELRSVYEKLKAIGNENLDVVKIDGVVYEKPHLKRIYQIINKLK